MQEVIAPSVEMLPVTAYLVRTQGVAVAGSHRNLLGSRFFLFLSHLASPVALALIRFDTVGS